MAFQDLKFRLIGDVPGLPALLAGTLINEALVKIFDEQMWSFQCKESGWLTPGLLFSSNMLSTGTITATAYSDKIVGDATAAAKWVAYTGTPALTQYQIRVPQYSLYNIIAFDNVNTFTLDRPWMEPSGGAMSYMIYQAYFPVPVADFKRFFEIRDVTNAAPMDYWTYSKRDLSIMDPQRTIFDQPGFVVPYGPDARIGSSTLGYMLMELWPHPLSIQPYSFSYLRRGSLLTLNSDTLPWPLNEELVAWRAKEVAYLWKEAQKGDGMQKGSGADWRFLAQAANAEYRDKLKEVKRLDRDLMELYFNRFVRDANPQSTGEPFFSNAGTLSVGRM